MTASGSRSASRLTRIIVLSLFVAVIVALMVDALFGWLGIVQVW